MYLNGLRDYFYKYKILKKPDFKCKTCPLKESENSCNKCTHAFYRLNLFINKDKVKQSELIRKINKKGISCGVGACPEIYKEKIFKKLKLYPKKRLVNAKLLGNTSIVFPINPHNSKINVKREISVIKKIIDTYI